MSEARSDMTDWARAHAAVFEVEPLVEVVKAREVHVGFVLSLLARLPPEKAGDPHGAVTEIREHLREIVHSILPPEGSRARVEIETAPTEIVFEPEGRMEPEVALQARVFHSNDYFAEATEAEEKKVYEVIRQLTAKGLKERRRRIS